MAVLSSEELFSGKKGIVSSEELFGSNGIVSSEELFGDKQDRSWLSDIGSGMALESSGASPKRFSAGASGEWKNENPLPGDPEFKQQGAVEDPWIDPLMAGSAGFGATGKIALSAGKKVIPALGKAILGGITGGAADVPIGVATEKIGEKHPAAAMPFNMLVGILSGVTIERAIENAVIKSLGKKATSKSISLGISEVRKSLEGGESNKIANEVIEDLQSQVSRTAPERKASQLVPESSLETSSSVPLADAQNTPGQVPVSTEKPTSLTESTVGKQASPDAPTSTISAEEGLGQGERTAGDFLKDINTVLQNKIGMTVQDVALNENQIAALERISQDAKKAGTDISSYMKKAGASPESIAKILTNKYNYEQMKKLPPEIQAVESSAEAKKNLKDLFRKTRSVQERLEIKKSMAREFEKRAITSSGKAISRETESGKKMVDLIDSTYMEGERLGGKWVADYKQNTNHLSKQEKLNLLNVLDGKEKPINDKVSKAATIERGRLNEPAKAAGDTGLTVLHPSVRKWQIVGEKGDWKLLDAHNNLVDSFTNKREAERVLNSYLYTPFRARENYLPRLPLRDVIAKKIDSVVEHLIKTGQVEKADKITGNLYSKEAQKEIAMRKISIYMRRNAERRYGNLQIARELDLPDWAYEKNIDIILPYYYEKSGMRVTQAKNWGRKDEVLRDLSEQIKTEGGDFSQATRVLDRILNKEAYDGSAETIVNALTGYNVFTKMGLSQVAQVGQRLSALYRTNGIAFAKTVAHISNNPGEATDFATRCGGALKGVSMHAKAEMAGGTAKSAEWFLTKTGFTAQDLKSRTYASVAGKFYAEYLTEKLSKNPLSTFAIRRLKQLNLDPDAIIKQRYKLTQEDLIKAGQKTETDTNFRNRVLDLPEFFSTKWGRVLTQFKSFSYAQTKMLRDNVVKEAMHGNVEPLIYVMLAGQAGGEAINDVRSLITGRERPKSMAKRMFENYAASGVMGMFEIMISTGKYGDPQLGPTVGTMIEAGKATKAVSMGSGKPAARLALGQVPVLGQRLKNEFTKATESNTQKATRKRENKYWEKHPWDARAILSDTPPKKR